MGTPTTLLEVPYNADPARDKARQVIAYTLLAIMAGVIVLAFVLVLWALASSGEGVRTNYDHIAGLLNIVFGPVVTLVGSATGFYFGAQASQNSSKKP